MQIYQKLFSWPIANVEDNHPKNNTEYDSKYLNTEKR